MSSTYIKRASVFFVSLSVVLMFDLVSVPPVAALTLYPGESATFRYITEPLAEDAAYITLFFPKLYAETTDPILQFIAAADVTVAPPTTPTDPIAELVFWFDSFELVTDRLITVPVDIHVPGYKVYEVTLVPQPGELVSFTLDTIVLSLYNDKWQLLAALSGELIPPPSAVPEPGTLFLLGSGLAGLGIHRYRRWKRGPR